MKMEDYPGMAGLRFDRNLKSFEKLMSFYLDAPQRLASTDKKIIATGPLCPPELVYSAGAIPNDICTREGLVKSIFKKRTDLTNKAVEGGMSPEFSPWSLVMSGSVMTGRAELPIHAYLTPIGKLDDQTIKGFQVLAQTDMKPLRFYEIPRYDPESEKWAIPFLMEELKQLFGWLTKLTGQKVTEANLKKTIKTGNQIRRDMAKLNEFMTQPGRPMPALEYYLVQTMLGDCAQDPETLLQLLTELLNELGARVEHKEPSGAVKSPVRIYMMGDETLELSLFNTIENYGATLAGCDFRYPLYYNVIEEETAPFEALAQWLWHMPNNLSTAERFECQIPAIKEQKPDAVVLHSVIGARRAPGVERLIRDLVTEKLGVRVLPIETALTGENREKVDYQIRAFLDIVK